MKIVMGKKIINFIVLLKQKIQHFEIFFGNNIKISSNKDILKKGYISFKIYIV
jgi:hypothetical protein